MPCESKDSTKAFASIYFLVNTLLFPAEVISSCVTVLSSKSEPVTTEVLVVVSTLVSVTEPVVIVVLWSRAPLAPVIEEKILRSALSLSS